MSLARSITAARNGAVPPAPYKGLVPYTEADAALFFGRDAERSIIVANLRSSRFTLLYGPSGVGKSSVVGAGVAHYLRVRARQNMNKRGSPEFGVVMFNQWRDDPIAGLEGRVREEVENLLGKKFDDEATFAAKSFSEQLKTWAERAGGDLLIILDQFEDYFLYNPNDDGAGSFAVEFPRLVTDPTARVNFLVSIREDAVAKLDKFEGRIPTLFDNYIRIDHLDRDAARDAIVKPIEQYNLSVGDPSLKVSIEPKLVDAVLDQVKTGQVSITESGAGRVKSEDDAVRIETPFLQLVMTRLWDEELRSNSRTLRFDTLTKLGGAERIVRTHLDNTMNSLPRAERDLSAGIFHYLVTPSGTKIAHTARDLAEYVHTSEKRLTPVLEKLSGTGIRILRPVAPPPDQVDAPARYEIFHDVLAPAMLDWRTRYLRQKRTRLIEYGAIAVGLSALILIGGLIFNLQRSQQQLTQKAQEAQELSQAILTVAPTAAASSEATPQATLLALRATAEAVGTSSAAVTCQGAPSIRFVSSIDRVPIGSPVYLTWDQPIGVNKVSISPEVGTVETRGSDLVMPKETTTYTLTAEGCGGTITRTVTVTVFQPTAALVPTASAVPPSETPLPTAVLPTATIAPTRVVQPTAVPVTPTETPLSAPPGVYVTAISVDPAEPHAGQPIVFHTSFLNTTGSTQQNNICVEIFLPDNLRRSEGVTTCTPQTIQPGTSQIDSGGWDVRQIGNCVLYLAYPIFEDQAKARTKYLKTDGTNIWTDFRLCP